jgi:aminoglycoside phosphotransferase (APT) family kinase protein
MPGSPGDVARLAIAALVPRKQPVEPPVLIDRVVRAGRAAGEPWDSDTVTYVARGLENHVIGVRDRQGRRIAVKVPIQRYVENENDQGIDSRDLLRQEYDLLTHLWPLGFPVPRPRALFFDQSGECADFLAAEFIEGDHSAVSDYETGLVVNRLHTGPVPAFTPVAQRLPTLEDTLAHLIVKRSEVVRRMTGCALAVPTTESVADLLRWKNERRALLHMDVRPENLIHSSGRVLALVDWSNALVGPPELELCRISEYGALSHDFLRGYGADLLANVPEPVLVIYRLYTATMLAVVFLSQAPDRARAATAAQRVVDLYAQLSLPVST